LVLDYDVITVASSSIANDLFELVLFSDYGCLISISLLALNSYLTCLEVATI